jgi:chemotaxis protein methyltransferase CheR
VNDSAMSPKADEAGYERVRRWLHERTGIFYEEKKKPLLTHRLLRVCERYGFDGLEALGASVESGRRHEVQLAVMHAASINHTYFFREPPVLDYFRAAILPKLPADGARIWSAAASTGDEAYTIAIIAAETRGRPWASRKIAVLGTDISDPVVSHAESGLFGHSHLEQTPDDIRARYFEPVGLDQYRVAEDIRRMCTFRRLNLTAQPYPFQRAFHVVFCRNVLYYFDRAQQQRTVEALYDTTESGGWLVTSVTESIRDLGTRWIPVSSGIYRKPA